MNYKSILFFLGIYSLIISFLSVLNILYSIYFDNVSTLNYYFITLLISFFIGIFFYFLGRSHSKNISLPDQILFIFLGFFLLPILISIPYFSSPYNLGLLNSYFESISGFTATGFTIIKNVNDIDKPLLLWRSSSQWVGGLFFLMAIIGTVGSKQIKIKPAYLVAGETSGKNFYNNFNFNFIRILLIYSFLTIFIIFLYNLSNIRLFDAFNLAFTTISSGGFVPKNNLNYILTTNVQTFIFSLTFLIPIFNFYLFFNIFTKKFTLNKHQEDLHLAVIMIVITLVTYFFIIPNEKLVNIFFYITSSISTSGISNYSSNLDVSLFFILLTIVGGSIVSTSSGFKYVRFYILLKISYQEIYRLVKPINIFDKNLFNAESKIDDSDSKISFLIFIFFIISIFILSSILTLDNLSFETSFKLSILTLTNTTSSSLYGLDNLIFFDLNNFSKMSIIVFMIFAKIEFIAILFLIKKLIFRE
tara:strand:+ start:18482 stop:19903 length:1422 start_codon:yes stop_codon:yes gene_type:complete